MCPYIDLGFVEIPTYGLMVALSIIAFYFTCTYIFEKKEKLSKSSVDKILIVSLISLFILGVFSYLFNSLFHSIEEGKIEMGGFTWLGGVLVSFPVAFVLFKKYCSEKIDGLTVFEYVIPCIVLAHGIGRIGCFLSGCCFGAPTDSIFGISYPKGTEAYYLYPNEDGTRSLKLWPTQLMETVFDLILFGIILGFREKLKNNSLEIYCFSYGIFRFLLEFLRADDRGATGVSVSPSQLMSIILIVYGVLVIIYKKKQRKKLQSKELQKEE